MAGMISEKTVKNIIGRRKKEIHKGDCGRILIAAGSEGMAGAAILAARSALRAGSGLVRTAIPKELFPIVQVGVPEATCIERRLPIPSLEIYDAVCVGPGLGESSESIEFVKELLKKCEKPLIIDADGLNIIAHNDLFALLRERSERLPNMTVLTPHMGEAKRLLGDEYERIVKSQSSAPLPQAVRLAIAEAIVQKTGAVTVLKGAGTIVAAEGREAYTNTTGNPGMATAGSGDVLSGIITSLAGQKRQLILCGENAYDICKIACDDFEKADTCNNRDEGFARSGIATCKTKKNAESQNKKAERLTAFEAAICGVYIHGLAGDLAARHFGEYGLTAGDLAQYTAFAIKQILSDKER